MQSAICLIVFSLCVSRLTATADPFSLFSRGCCDDEPHSGMKTDVRRKKSHLLVCHCGAQLHVRHVHCVKLFYFFLWSRLIAGLCWTVCVFCVATSSTGNLISSMLALNPIIKGLVWIFWRRVVWCTYLQSVDYQQQRAHLEKSLSV